MNCDIHFSQNRIIRGIVLGFLVVAHLFCPQTFCAQGSADEKRPNIVFAFGDDLGRYASAYRDPHRPTPNDVIETPNFDRIAKEGTLFDNALVSVPSCTPSRAAIVSCRHFFRNGSHSQLHHPWVKGVPDPFDKVRGFPLMLQDSGYHIGWTYKMHISEDRMGGKKRNYRSAGSRFNTFSQNAMKAADIPKAKKALLGEVRKNFQSFLDDRKSTQPFFYWFNPTNTHRAWAAGSGKKLWGIEPDQLKGKLPAFLPDRPEIREDFADYLGEVKAFDESVGVLLSELERIGELDNTIVVVSGDHGAPGFPRGKCNVYDFGSQVPLAIRWPEKISSGRKILKPVSLIDLGPTFLAAAGLKPTDDMDGQNLLPALSPNTKDHESSLRNYAIVGRENHVRESRPGGLPYPIRAIRTKNFLLVNNFAPNRWPVAQPPLAAPLVKPERKNAKKSNRRMDIDFGPTRDFFAKHENKPDIKSSFELGFGKRSQVELYDIRSDPDQMINLANDPKYADVRQRLHQQLFSELKKGNDPRVVGKGDAFDNPPYTIGDEKLGIPEIQ